MIPRYLRDCVKLLLDLTVILMFVFSTSSMTECGPKTTETLRHSYVSIINIGIKLCQLKCIEDGACLNVEYNIETLTCRLSRDESRKIKKKEGYISLPRNHSNVPAGSCASKTCNVGLRCLETRSGKSVCVQDGMQNYREKSPKHNIGKQDTLENNPLHDACRKGDLGRVRRILYRGMVDVNSRGKKLGMTPLMMAAQKGHRRIFDLLIRKGANVTLVDANGNNILHWACLRGHIAMVRYVLSQYSVDVNSRTKSGSTPLMKAAYWGHRDVSDYLVCMGANISLVDEDGDSILHWACRGGHAKMVKNILAQGLVNINSRGIYGRTPLMIAAFYGHREAFDILLNEGAQISSEDGNGDNILHLASFGGNVEMVKHILSQNLADINARDKDGDTAAMMAHRRRHRAVYDLLVSIGCPVQ